MESKKKQEENALVIEPEGRLDTSTAPQLEEALRASLSRIVKSGF